MRECKFIFRLLLPCVEFNLKASGFWRKGLCTVLVCSVPDCTASASSNLRAASSHRYFLHSPVLSEQLDARMRSQAIPSLLMMSSWKHSSCAWIRCANPRCPHRAALQLRGQVTHGWGHRLVLSAPTSHHGTKRRRHQPQPYVRPHEEDPVAACENAHSVITVSYKRARLVALAGTWQNMFLLGGIQ